MDEELELTDEEREVMAKMGRKGGLRCMEKHGKEHFQRIGKMGGEENARRRSLTWYQKLGALGGKAVLEKYGKEFFENMGKAGGTKTAERGLAYYAEIGRKGGQAKGKRRADRD